MTVRWGSNLISLLSLTSVDVKLVLGFNKGRGFLSQIEHVEYFITCWYCVNQMGTNKISVFYQIKCRQLYKLNIWFEELPWSRPNSMRGREQLSDIRTLWGLDWPPAPRYYFWPSNGRSAHCWRWHFQTSHWGGPLTLASRLGENIIGRLSHIETQSQ